MESLPREEFKVARSTAPWNILSETVFNPELSQRVHKDDTTEFKREVVEETISKLGPAAIEISVSYTHLTLPTKRIV